MPGTMGGAKLVFPDYEMEKIGIIGLGYVGGAVKNSMDHGLIQLVLLDPTKQLDLIDHHAALDTVIRSTKDLCQRE